MRFFFFFFNDTATTEIYTLSLHDALPIYHHHEERKPERCEQAHLQPLAQHVAVEGVHDARRQRGQRREPGQPITRSAASSTSLQSPPCGALPGFRMRHNPTRPATPKMTLGVHIAKNGDRIKRSPSSSPPINPM